MYVCMYVCMYVYTYACCMYACMYVCMYVCYIIACRTCIEFMERNVGKNLGCAVCSSKLSTSREVFAVPGAEGMVGAYVNPHGYLSTRTLLILS